jgi:heparan-alpha-glucosaminide N-acetyltransferase
MSTRVQSIDIFRGLTILTMVFVNDLAGVRDIPAWMKHAVDGSNSMTFVDVVFPAFLFIVGMSIPLALQRRRAKGASSSALWGHVLIRFAGLLALGFFMVNISRLSPELTGMDRHIWSTLFYLGAIAVWAQPGELEGAKRLGWRLVRIAGVVLIIILAVLYRSGDAGHPGWMHTQWWGILGLIGWTYLVCSAAFILVGANIPALTALLGISVSLYIGDKSGALQFLGPVNDILWIGGHIGGHASIAGAGMIAGLMFGPTSPAPTPRSKAFWLIGMAVMLAAAGYLLGPLYGISKNMATPAWSLYSAAICCLLFLMLYWLADLRQRGNWFGFAEPAGSNPLLAYLLPDMFYGALAIIGIEHLWGAMGSGVPGIARSVIFSLVIVWLTGHLTRLGLRLKL